MLLRMLVYTQMVIFLHLSLPLLWSRLSVGEMVDWLFLEGALLLILGGILDFSSSIPIRNLETLLHRSLPWSYAYYRRQGQRVNRIVSLGILLCLEAGMLSFTLPVFIQAH